MNRQLVVSYLLLVAVALGAFTVPVAFTLTAQLRDDTLQSVRREADTVALMAASGDPASRRALAALVHAYQHQTPGRADVLALGRTAVAPLPMPAAPDDQAFTDALAGRTTTRWGRSAALNADGLVVTVPVQQTDGTVVAAVRVSYPAAPLNRRLWQIWGFRAALAAAVLAVAGVLGAAAARRLTRPLRLLNEMATRFGDGDLKARSPETGPPETRTLARTLNTGAERLDTLVGAQRAFVADASHQLRTPLTALRLSLDNIADGVDDESVRPDVDQATAEVVRMSRLVNALLALARAEAEVAAPPETVALDTAVAGRFEAWRAAGEERKVRFRYVPDSGGLRVLAGHGHLEQVLDNVLSNALQVSPDGAAVTLRVRQAGAETVLEVLDEGPGMPADERSRAFNRFWRGRGLTGRTGSGLGLAIVKQLVTDDGGSVALDDAPGGGLCVRITLRSAAPRSGD